MDKLTIGKEEYYVFGNKAYPVEQVHTVCEACPDCGEDIIVTGWEVSKHGYEIYCPYCGEKEMLCDECLNGDDPASCDWCSETNTCKRK